MSQPANDSAVNVVWYGSEQPLPERRLVRAGPFTAVLEGADLRYLALSGEVVILRLYAAIRDQSWGTIAPVFTRYELEQGERSFSLSFAAEHVSGGEQGVDFAWQGRITGSDDGTIVCEMDGAARSSFWRNRIGWCVLHPMELAGQAVEIRTGDRVVRGEFPVRISPHQPFFDIEEMTHDTAGGNGITIAFAGDVFETEDQRNWTDASYKTYSTPLRIPYPVELAAGERVWQSITVTATAQTNQTTGEALAQASGLTVRVGSEPGQALPPIGLSTAGHHQALSEREIVLLQVLNLGHLHHVVDLASPPWSERLAQAADQAGDLECALELEVLTDDGRDMAQLFAVLSSLAASVARIAVFPTSGVTSTDQVLATARAARDEAALTVPIGGGSRAYFTQLNRGVPSPELLDFVAYPVNPQVHAFDNASMVETLAAQATTVETARAITDNRPVVVGPITLLPRINPDAVPTTEAPPAGSLPATVDVRQPSLFAAGWTIGSVRHLASAGVEALTYYETTGWRGVIERSDHELRVPSFHSRPGIAFPIYHALADLGEFAGGRLLPIDVSDRLVIEAIALVRGDRLRLLMVSFQGQEATVRVSLPALMDLQWRSLDETTYGLAADDPDRFRRSAVPLPVAERQVDIQLRPFAIVTIDGRVGSG